MKYVLYFLKQMIFPLVYLILLSLTSVAVTSLGNNLLWLKYILLAIILLFYCFIIGAVAFKDGQEEFKTLHHNDIQRERIILTGDDVPLDLVKEYKPWKGLLIGLAGCVPLIVLMIVHTVLISQDPTNGGAGVIAGYLYDVVFAFFKYEIQMVLTPMECYWTLLALPIFLLSTGIPYYVGAMRLKKQYDKIERKKIEIYGDKK